MPSVYSFCTFAKLRREILRNKLHRFGFELKITFAENNMFAVRRQNALRVWPKKFAANRDNSCHIPYSLVLIQIQNSVNQDIRLNH